MAYWGFSLTSDCMRRLLLLSGRGQIVPANASPASRPVLRLVRQHPPHPAARVFLVAAVAGNQVDVQVRHGLAAGLAVVDADVVAVRLVVLVEDLLGVRQRLEQRGLLGFGGLEQGGDVAARDDDGVTQRDGKAVAVGDGELVLGEDAVGVEVAEGTRSCSGFVHAWTRIAFRNRGGPTAGHAPGRRASVRSR